MRPEPRMAKGARKTPRSQVGQDGQLRRGESLLPKNFTAEVIASFRKRMRAKNHLSRDKTPLPQKRQGYAGP